MKLSKLSTGYWNARWSKNLWIQWPVGREAELSDGFGWITKQHVDAANRLVSVSRVRRLK